MKKKSILDQYSGITIKPQPEDYGDLPMSKAPKKKKKKKYAKAKTKRHTSGY